ncbi:hypothetical protein M5X11_27290 [Paenibacillus alginolyticus]|uniref:hypothetical protein n=1 Tax=Paenibacillus alginolyticus TaxID=59839 RepID=UPI0003FE9B24|nr:hypothetical protein [Paenibacillus alginolyticus]MCY9668583.1 hypothetical protein [Paenibacillus alginolyticus]
MKTLQQDSEFDNAILFGQYVMVLTEWKWIGGGLIESYDEKGVLVGGRLYSRSKSTFIISPPPQCYVK